MIEVVGSLVALACVALYTAINAGMLLAVRIIRGIWNLMAR